MDGLLRLAFLSRMPSGCGRTEDSPVARTFSVALAPESFRSDDRLFKARALNAALLGTQTETHLAFRSFVLAACASDTVPGTIQPMKCAFCGKALPQGSSSRKRFCDDSHRASYWREHSKQSPKSKRGKELNGAKSQVGASGTDKPGPRKPQILRARPHTITHSSSRVPMVAQLRGLAPEGAVGYRLVLPTRTPDDVPRLSPPLDANGYQGHYSLCPFQAPFDVRLTDGQTYRVVWIGASGEVIPPKPDGTIPGLHFFLSSNMEPVGVEAESTSGASQLAHIPTETERLATALATSIPVVQDLLTY